MFVIWLSDAADLIDPCLIPGAGQQILAAAFSIRNNHYGVKYDPSHNHRGCLFVSIPPKLYVL